jgi:glyoxylase-like metal-dependent hydrolase (beta-lactamase superfamily II)
MRAITCSLGIVVAFLIGAAERVRGQDSPGAFKRVVPLVPYPITLSQGIHLLGGLGPSSAYVIETSEGLVLVDSGRERDLDELKSEMAALDLDWQKVCAILLTHAHADHTGGAESLRGSTGAKVYAGRGDAGVLRAGGPREAFFSNYYLPGDQPHRTTVDVELVGGETLTFGDARIRVLATPGHTPGSTCYLLEKGPIRALFMGDVLSRLVGDEKCRLEAYKPLGTYSAYLAPRFRGDARAYLESLRALRAIPVPDLVLPGHPRGDPSPENPRLTQARWEAIIDGGIHDMTALAAHHAADGADFLDGSPLRLLADLYYLGDFHGTAVYGFFAARFFLVDAPGGPGLVDFINERQRALGLKPTPPSVVLLTACGPDETAGLAELVEHCHPEVFVAPGGAQRIRKLCPAGTVLLSPEALRARSSVDLAPVYLRSPTTAPTAYKLKLSGKTVLFSGRLPIKLRDKPEYERIQVADRPRQVFLESLARSRDTALDFLVSINRLGEITPDLWLPSIPTDGQNANIYDDEWKILIDFNYRLGYFYIAPRR